MNDFVLTLGVHVGVIALWALFISLLTRQRVHASWLIAAIVVFLIHSSVLMHGRQILEIAHAQALLDFFHKSQWNWPGKILSLATTLVMTAMAGLVVKDIWTRTGFTLRQAAGSVLPALLVAALLIGASAALEYKAHDGTDISLDRLLFQAIAPGVDEEPMFRGLLLLCLAGALGFEGPRFLGVSLGGLVSTILFGAVHGLSFQDGAFQVSWIAIAATGATGFGLLWIRERTGSLVLPILTHNAINVAISFF